MKRQARFNKELGDYLSLGKPSMKRKTLLYQMGEFWDYLFNKEIPHNINDIKDTSKILVIEHEESWWDKLKRILMVSWLKSRLEKRKREREDEDEFD